MHTQKVNSILLSTLFSGDSGAPWYAVVSGRGKVFVGMLIIGASPGVKDDDFVPPSDFPAISGAINIHSATPWILEQLRILRLADELRPELEDWKI